MTFHFAHGSELRELKTMRKIAFVSTIEGVPWGGSELLWAGAAERLARQGVQVHVSVKDWGQPVKQIEHLRSVGCKIFTRTFPPPYWERVRWKFLKDSYTTQHLRAAGAGADLVVVAQAGHTDGLIWMEAARSEGLKYAVISQAAAETWWPADEVMERLAACMDEAEAAYFVSQGNLELTRRQIAGVLQRGRVVWNPFNVRYNAQPKWPGDACDELRLACMARLDSAQKGQDILMRVLDQPKWRARKVHVTLAGSGVHERVLRRMAAGLNLPNLEFAGFIEDVEQFWGGYHAIVLPSRFEGMPLALIEAMLCRRACIVTDVGGNCELVRDGVNGFVAKAPTVELVDDALERAWENRGRLRELGETAGRDVRERVPADPIGEFVRDLETLLSGVAHLPQEAQRMGDSPGRKSELAL